MKRYLLFFFALALAASLAPIAQAQQLQSQKDAMVRVMQAVGSVVETAKKVTGNAGYIKKYGQHGFLEEGCVFGVMLRPNASASETFDLRKGQAYIFIGGGDKSAREIDLVITDSRGRVVDRNTNNNKTSPFARFEPKSSGRYTMTLRLKRSVNGSAFCAVSVLRSGGVQLPLDRVVEAAAKVVAYSAIVFGASEGGQYTRERNTWAIYGAVLQSKQSLSFDPKRYNTARRGFFAVGDERIKDLDLALVKYGGGVVAKEMDSGDVPGILYGTTAGSAYSVRLTNKYSTGPAFIMTTLIDVPADFTEEKLEAFLAKNNLNANDNNAPAGSPLAGRWRGQWRDDDGVQGGEVIFNIANNGALSGEFNNVAAPGVIPIAGTVKPDGSFFFKYSYAGTGYIAKGQLQTDGQTLAGRAGFSSNGQTFFSGGDFELQRP